MIMHNTEIVLRIYLTVDVRIANSINDGQQNYY